MCAFGDYDLGARAIMYEKELPRIKQFIVNDGNVRLLFIATPDIRRQVDSFVDATAELGNVLLIDGQDENTMAALDNVALMKLKRLSVLSQYQDQLQALCS